MFKQNSLEDRLSYTPEYQSPLEEKVSMLNKFTNFFKKTVHYSYYTGKVLLSLGAVYLTAGAITLQKACIVSFGNMAGRYLSNLKNKVRSRYYAIANEGAVGAVGGSFLHGIFTGIHKISDGASDAYGNFAGLITRGVLAVAQIPVYMSLIHERLNRIMIKDYKKVYWPEMKQRIKRVVKWLGIPIDANLLFVSSQYNIPVAAGISVAYNYIRTSPTRK